MATSLFPIPQRRDTHPDHQRKLRLGLVQFTANRLDIGRLDLETSRSPCVPALDSSRLLEALHEVVEIFLLQWSSSLINLDRVSTICMMHYTPMAYQRQDL
jgi:hypothetical protein